MELEAATDTTNPDYWLNWRVFLCAIWVLSSMVIASYLIWKYEAHDQPKSDGGATKQDVYWLLFKEAWMPCLKIHPCWLLAFRVISFSLLLAALIVKVKISGGHIFNYYTQWTFSLTTIYFGFGTLLSIWGCYVYCKLHNSGFYENYMRIDAENGHYMPLACGENSNTLRNRKVPNSLEGSRALQAAGIWSCLFQVIYQINAGAVILTDLVYWFIIFPYFTIADYSISFLTVDMHTTNALFLLGDAALNRLPVPWFRISYFLLWTGVFVIFQWVGHACISIRWPYPFLELSSPYAPLWYSLMGLMHIPCYGIFSLLVKLKHFLLSKWFPQFLQLE